ncbi:MAG: glutaminase [Candidatus Micrarchaeota archaeon]|nr:glutaminase [Candidatus Micrarchaeota archaeon]
MTQTKSDLGNTIRKLQRGKPQITEPATLRDTGVTQGKIKLIDRFAWEHAYGATAAYILALIDPRTINPAIRVTLVGDLWGNVISAGNGSFDSVKVSFQSTIKHITLLYALKLGELPEEISGVAQTNKAFNDDRVLDPAATDVERPDNAVNNAGAISSGRVIGKNFDRFLDFIRTLTGNPKLAVDETIFKSEFDSGFNNFAISYRLAAKGRLLSHEEVLDAYTNYIRACSIVATPKEILKANLVLAAGGMDLDRRLNDYKSGQQFYDSRYCIVPSDGVVRADNALNVAGLYLYQGIMNLLVSGARATTMKSGVSGVQVAIQPGLGAALTYHVWLDAAGNSTYGNVAHILLNEVMAGPSPVPVRLSSVELERALAIQEAKDTPGTVAKVLELVRKGHPSNMYHLKPHMIQAMVDKHLQELKLLRSIGTKDGELNGVRQICPKGQSDREIVKPPAKFTRGPKTDQVRRTKVRTR